MDIKEFIQRANLAIKNNHKDDVLLTHNNKFLRAQILLKLIKSLSNFLKVFEFKNEIVFKKNLPFILIDGLYFRIEQLFYLKKSGSHQVSEVKNTIKFLEKNKIQPDLIIDAGACWGEYSLFLANHFKKSKVFSIEGSKNNFHIFATNLENNPSLKDNIKPFNLILSDNNGKAEIQNHVSGMNKVRKYNELPSANYITVNTTTLRNFCKNNSIKKIDFIKIDIEGGELKLLDDLIYLPIKSIQIELIKDNLIYENINFLKKISTKYRFYNFENHTQIKVNKIIDGLEEHFKHKNTIDLFLIKKND